MNEVQLHIDFDPSYTHVIVHAIRSFREGTWLDRLENARHNTIQPDNPGQLLYSIKRLNVSLRLHDAKQTRNAVVFP